MTLLNSKQNFFFSFSVCVYARYVFDDYCPWNRNIQHLMNGKREEKKNVNEGLTSNVGFQYILIFNIWMFFFSFASFERKTERRKKEKNEKGNWILRHELPYKHIFGLAL